MGLVVTNEQCAGAHRLPVHFNRGRHGSVWICRACGVQTAGPKLPDEEREALRQFAIILFSKHEAERQGVRMAKIELAILVGAESKEWLANLTEQLDRMEAMQDTKTTKKKAPVEDDADDEEAEDELPKAKARGAKKNRPLDEEPDEEESDDDDAEDELPKAKKKAKKVEPEEDESDDDDEEPAPKKKAKKKGPTIDDVHDACQVRAKAGGKAGRAEVLKILKKGWKVESVAELDEEDYQDVIDALEVEE